MDDRFLSLARPCVREMEAYHPGLPMDEVRRIAGREDILRLSANESSEAPSAAVLAAVQEALLEVNRYPDSLQIGFYWEMDWMTCCIFWGSLF